MHCQSYGRKLETPDGALFLGPLCVALDVGARFGDAIHSCFGDLTPEAALAIRTSHQETESEPSLRLLANAQRPVFFFACVFAGVPFSPDSFSGPPLFRCRRNPLQAAHKRPQNLR
jgi:hypothetical protein